MEDIDTVSVRTYLRELQERIIDSVSGMDGTISPRRDEWTRKEGGGGLSIILEEGAIIEKGGVNFSDVTGRRLPPSSTAKRPELSGAGFHAIGVSVVLHPLNPYVPTTHMNVRFISASKSGEPSVWWFGGGFDLTPYYGFEEDAVHWHKMAKAACDPFGKDLYERFKERCDRYFFLKHRNECRGIGGLFFDDFNDLGFDDSFACIRSIGDTFIFAYEPIVEKRMNLPYSDREREFQLYRRGRYVEFNLIYDRGTLFGLQSDGRTESILMSLPPAVKWRYDWSPDPGSPEEELYTKFLKPRRWVG